MGPEVRLEIAGNKIQAALIFAAKDDIRYYLNGVLIEWEPGGFYMVASNGHIMLVQWQPDEKIETNGEVILPREMLAAISRKDTVVIDAEEILPEKAAWGARRIVQHGAGHTVEYKSVEGKFPRWRNILLPECWLSSKTKATDEIFWKYKKAVDDALSLIEIGRKGKEYPLAFDDATGLFYASVQNAIAIVAPRMADDERTSSYIKPSEFVGKMQPMNGTSTSG